MRTSLKTGAFSLVGLALAACTSVVDPEAVQGSISGAEAMAGRSSGAIELPSVSVVQTDDPDALALISALEGFLPGLVKGFNEPGLNLALSYKGEVVWEAAYGWQDAHAGIPQTPETVFRSGSMGKTYTGVAIMQLVEAGILSLDDPINNHLPFEVTNPLGGGEITIFHLMTHTSGLSSNAAGSVFADPRPLLQRVKESYEQDQQQYFGAAPTWYKPVGAERQYANLGIATLGLIVELNNPEGVSFSEYVERHIMRPLQLNSSVYPPQQSEAFVDSEIWSKTSKGYAGMGPVWVEGPEVYFEDFPSGGFLAPPADHLRFLIAMARGGELNGVRILSETAAQKMLTPQLQDDITHFGFPIRGEQQGLVWWLRNWGQPNEAFHHGGGHMFGWRTMGIYWPRYEIGLVVAGNSWDITTTGTPIHVIENVIDAWMRQKAPEAPPVPQDISNPAWKASYLRGLLFAEAYHYSIFMQQRLTPAQIQEIAEKAVTQTWSRSPSLWDPEAFVEGVLDMSAVEPTAAAIHDFAKSDQMQISLEEARALAPQLGFGVGPFGSLAGLLPAAAE